MMVETVMATPLLVPSAADGGTASNRLSTEARLGQRPYFRFRLVSQRLPPKLPLLLEQRSITPEDWNEFWSRIKALVLKVERLENLYFHVLACILVLLCTVTVLFPPFGDGVVLLRAVSSLNGTEILDLKIEDIAALYKMVPHWLPVLIPLLLFFLADRLLQTRNQALMEAIELYCKDGEEVNVFHANGYGLECELLPNEVNVGLLYLNILPMERPYTRFEVYNGMPTFPGYNSSYLSSSELLAAMTTEWESVLHSSVAVEYESVSVEVWNSFSSAMTKLYEPQRQLTSLAAKGFIVELLMLLLLFLGPASIKIKLGNLFADLQYVGVLGQMFMCKVYLVYRYYCFMDAKLA
jgi:hypothetical protein